MKQNNIILKAIHSSGLLSKSQKSILQYIVSFDLNRGVTASAIMNHMQITKQAVNFSLKELIKRNFVIRSKDRVFIYKVNQNKLEEILEDYSIHTGLKQD